MKLLLAAGCALGTLAYCLFAQQFTERYRPQFHFSPTTNWTNDPCGLVYAFGKYHLFFQHNPFANVSGHMSWGHAVSTDLVHWTQLPVAIPDDPKVAIFTGSSVVDAQNTSGLCKAKGCIVSIYTGYTPKTATESAHQTQNLAYSQDGFTWTKYSANPVLDLGKSDTRDPKVFWHEPTHRWIMVIVHADEQMVSFFGSPNLIKWDHLSDFGPQAAVGGQWECPDIVRLPVRNKPGAHRWVLKIGLNPGHIAGGSGEQYFTGDFDGTTFHSDNPKAPVNWADYGRDSYCALTFNDNPTPEAPKVIGQPAAGQAVIGQPAAGQAVIGQPAAGQAVIGWMSNWQYAGTTPTAPWRGAMTLPRTLSLAETNAGLRLIQTPADALQTLRDAAFQYTGASDTDLNQNLAKWPNRSQTFEIEATISPGNAKQIELNLLETTIGIDIPKGFLYVDRTKNANGNFNKAFPSKTEAPLQLGTEALKLRIFADESSIEVFAQDGRISLTNLVFPNPDSTAVSLTTSGGALQRINFKMWILRSIWKQASK